MLRHELADFQKGQIDGANQLGHTVSEIDHKFGHLRTTIVGVIACI